MNQTLSPQDIRTFYQPSKCDRRVWLDSHGVTGAEPDEFASLLADLGRQHEDQYLSTLGEYLDIHALPSTQRINKTIEAIQNRVNVIYQGELRCNIPDLNIDIIGIPDFLIREGDNYIIRDCKLSKHANESDHPEIVYQLELYGLLFERAIGHPPARLEVVLGDNTIVQIPYDSSSRSIEQLHQILSLRNLPEEPYSPVGWSKCNGCGFRDRCWTSAIEEHDPALIYGVDQGLAIQLRSLNVHDFRELNEKFTVESLTDLKRPVGKMMKRVGKSAESILTLAQSMQEKRIIQRAPLEVQHSDYYVMFDLEGVPPYSDDLDLIYLWGLQVFGKQQSNYLPAVAPFTDRGEEIGWKDFLKNADSIFKKHGDVPFIHWHHYETSKVKAYIEKFGDSNGIAERVLNNCIDLLPITRKAFAMPLSSYSLKEVEKLAGYKRTMEEFGGAWSIVQYYRAKNSNDEKLQQEVIGTILRYNEEDLQATWSVMQWIKGLAKG